ncbi:chromate transporter, partial [bacterium]|nr:chromate transporter [bacterium]
ALVLPMLIVTSIVFKLYKKFSDNKYVKSVLYVLRPCTCGLLGAVGLKLICSLIVLPKDYLGLILLFILFLMTFKFTRNPLNYLLAGAISGIIVWIFNIQL